MKRPTKRILIGAGAAIIVALSAAGIYGWYLYKTAEQIAVRMYEEPAKPVYVSKDPEIAPKKQSAVMDNREPFTVLLLGVDERAHDHGRSDTMILLAVNPAKKSILMFNIPRDSRTEIVGHGTVDKINHAYSFGGVDMSIQTVENFLDYPIDYYIKINMEGFARLIDLIGGVEVDNPFAFQYEGHDFKKGSIMLNGKEALLYSRMRYDDPRGDFGRNARQRDILRAVMSEALQLSNVTRIQEMLDKIGESVKTNITFDEMKTFVAGYRPALERIDSVELKGKGQTRGGIWYYIVGDHEREWIHNLIKEQMK